MKLNVRLLAAGLLCVVMAGGCTCNQEKKTVESNVVKEPHVIDLYSDLAIQNAIIAQHTIYPYHFVNNSAALNALGQRDLAVLANHFAQNPGELTVRRDQADNALQQARIETVMARLSEGGVEASRIRISDGMAGGAGMSTSDIIEVLVRSREPFTDSRGYSTGFSTQQ